MSACDPVAVAVPRRRPATVVGLPALALALLYLATRPDLTGPRRIPRWMLVAACMGLAVTLFLTARTFMQLKAVFS
jgi:Mn2+/Fe2+ NRAMP family transporter